MSILIGLAGQRGSGKDTVADIFTNNLSNCYRYAFADKLKSLIDFECFPSGYPWSWDNREWKITANPYLGGKSPAQACQILGSAFRQLNDRYWISPIAAMYEAYREKDIVFLVTDVRYRNEYDWIKENNGIVLYVSGRFIPDSRDPQHESEIDDAYIAAHADFHIKNDADILALTQQVGKVIDAVLN